MPQKAEANVNCRIFPGVKIEEVRQQLQALSGPDVTVTAVEGSQTPETAPTPLRADITEAYKAAVATRFKDAPVMPFQSAGATDGAFLRANGIDVYGFGGLWGIVGQREGAHGLDERVWAEGFPWTGTDLDGNVTPRRGLKPPLTLLRTIITKSLNLCSLVGCYVD